ncbi:hypothetical protein CWI42_050680 [Ordospora colligata]|uniref:Uncharacterized protein n=1 Tax=Ordospora colligata OC4 TaxID=1354746 RepID=A0A0B2UKA5_9MICR|nr:uncharacterized protein M896_050710 [Ordospora colligata OC4]KHN69664.1 hypothetical protein M896_050710 [Ordospora colligata OC4]TBU15783.1 hypothetical protein CWI41_050700 [Ordospora colligata]TBU15911.1 hypothetical protein CWI40_050720 [Ordospora colligata]TBU18805.1 hypothetical protein CWI42_050680 [Ordospora colligata]
MGSEPQHRTTGTQSQEVYAEDCDYIEKQGINNECANQQVNNQIDHQVFLDIIQEYFVEMDAQAFEAVVSKTVINDTLCMNQVFNNSNDLCSYLCDDTPSDVFSDNIRCIEMLYKKQVIVNNNRKAVLEKKLKDRLKYFGYWEILRSIDEEMENLATNKKRSRCIEERIIDVIDRREQLLSLFADIDALESDFEGYEALFDPAEDVDCREYGIERIEYFGSV